MHLRKLKKKHQAVYSELLVLMDRVISELKMIDATQKPPKEHSYQISESGKHFVVRRDGVSFRTYDSERILINSGYFKK